MGSHLLALVTFTPLRAAFSLTKYSSPESWPKRSVPAASASKGPNLPKPCTMMQPKAAASFIVTVLPGSTVVSLAAM